MKQSSPIMIVVCSVVHYRAALMGEHCFLLGGISKVVNMGQMQRSSVTTEVFDQFRTSFMRLILASSALAEIWPLMRALLCY